LVIADPAVRLDDNWSRAEQTSDAISEHRLVGRKPWSSARAWPIVISALLAVAAGIVSDRTGLASLRVLLGLMLLAISVAMMACGRRLRRWERGGANVRRSVHPYRRAVAILARPGAREASRTQTAAPPGTVADGAAARPAEGAARPDGRTKPGGGLEQPRGLAAGEPPPDDLKNLDADGGDAVVLRHSHRLKTRTASQDLAAAFANQGSSAVEDPDHRWVD
jgi:hypothetical protein